MKIFLLLLLSVPLAAQPNLAKLGKNGFNGFLIKYNGALLLFEKNDYQEITEEITLKNGWMIRPEGIVILKSGKELVLKNGELVDQSEIVRKAADSTLNEVRLRQLESSNAKLIQDNETMKASLNLILKKMELLEKKAELINQKTDLLTERYGPDKSGVQYLNKEINTMNKKINEIDKALLKFN